MENGKIVRKYVSQSVNGVFNKHFSESNLAGGIYTLRVIANNKVKDTKLFIEKGVATIVNEKVEAGRKK